MEQLPVFAKNLRYLRGVNKLTQQEVSKKLGISRSVYSEYETGTKMPTIAGLQRICTLYKHYDMDAIMSRDVAY